MEFQTKVDIKPSVWKIEPCEKMMFIGSCFAGNIGRRFQEEMFRVVVNPFGVMYNPVSVLHSVATLCDNRYSAENSGNGGHGFRPATTVLSLGTNHVYVDKQTGLVVDNCCKRPASDFIEKQLSVDECCDALCKAIEAASTRVILTVSPVRYRKYGFHGSRLSKATLLLAVDKAVKAMPAKAEYFPSYEIVNDELRDYRFYNQDMLHPSSQAVEYIFQRFVETYFSDKAKTFLHEWKPLKEALAHRPMKPESEEYKIFIGRTMKSIEALKNKYPDMEMPPQCLSD